METARTGSSHKGMSGEPPFRGAARPAPSSSAHDGSRATLELCSTRGGRGHGLLTVPQKPSGRFLHTRGTRASAETGAAGRAADGPPGLTLTHSEPTSATRMAPSTMAPQPPHFPLRHAQMAQQAGRAWELTADALDSAQCPHPPPFNCN